MPYKKLILWVVSAALVLLVNVSCQRTADPPPDPFGPGLGNLTLSLEAYPNVLYVSEPGQRETSTITATVKQQGTPLGGATVIFTVESGAGEFTNYLRRVAVVTDPNGVATAIYVSPLMGDFNRDFDVTIEGQIQTDSPYYIWKAVQVRVMKSRS